MKGSKSVHSRNSEKLIQLYMHEPSALLLCRRVWLRAVRPRKEHQGEVAISLLETCHGSMKGRSPGFASSVSSLMCMGKIKLNLLSTLLVFLRLYLACFLYSSYCHEKAMVSNGFINAFWRERNLGGVCFAGLEMPFLHESCTYTRRLMCPVGASSDTFCLARKFWGRDADWGNEGLIFNFSFEYNCFKMLYSFLFYNEVNQPCVYIWPLCLTILYVLSYSCGL